MLKPSCVRYNAWMPWPIGKRASNFEDLTTRRFGRLVVIELAPKRHAVMWLCRCDCGQTKVVAAAVLKRGDSRSCGCFRSENSTRVGFTRGRHYGCKTPEYASWHGARNRCRNENSKDYKNYGGRGIIFDPRWDKFETFLIDMGKKPTPEHQLDRKENDGPYSPENCRWATRKEQMNNRRATGQVVRGVHPVTLRGRTQTIAQWARELGITWSTMDNRVRAGWSEERLLGRLGA